MLDQEDLSRYNRQLVMEEIGYDGQIKIRQAKVLVIGAGGLGSPILYYLAAAGIGTIGIADFDIVDMSNLQRQILHSENTIGVNKTESAKKRLLELNRKINYQIHTTKINPNNIGEIIDQYDIVVDAVDNKEARYIINDACQELKKTVVEGAVSKFEGIVTVIIPSETKNYRELFPQDTQKSYGGDIGIVGAVAGVIGSIMSLEVIKIVVEEGNILKNKMLVYDGQNLVFRIIKLCEY